MNYKHEKIRPEFLSLELTKSLIGHVRHKTH